MAESLRIFVAGPAAWNLLVFLDHLPEPVPQMMAARHSYPTLGGTSAGKALNLRHLGAEVTLRTVLGADAPSGLIRSALESAGVSLIIEEDADGRAEQHLNLMDSAGQRLSIYLHGSQLGPDGPRHDSASVAAMQAADAVIIDLADASRPLLRTARELGLPIWCDLHDYDGVNPFHAEFADAADYLFLSADRMPEPEVFMQQRINAGARLVVCTHGADGATALDGDGGWHQVEAEPISALVDSNGAGDAFLAGFLVSYLRSGLVGDALRSGARQGAATVQSPALAPLPI
ncbi:sugar kinase [Microlunatus panaciterrae]|uniref:Sugar/nucleoside kinase (Ribokinase family) n=1 Tax=Microlunatus panaciterrae TaxID=400768 RepID=A0ABS2RHV2_9ACTN|nr:carbohydrate kinase family protein [Microlunatus panaciterrae]MBM7798575.1 sugar/nucleoside kinase (ribokinase family) [Microlunatus panaciterrae]